MRVSRNWLFSILMFATAVEGARSPRYRSEQGVAPMPLHACVFAGILPRCFRPGR